MTTPKQKAPPLTQWEVYGMLAAIIEELDRDSRTAMAMERESLDASADPYETPDNEYGLFFRGFDSMSDLLWAEKQDAKQRSA